MWIETIMHMSGTRANGDKYPPGFTPFEVEDWEGQHLIRGGMAREVPAPALPAPPVPEPLPPPELAPREEEAPVQEEEAPVQEEEAPVQEEAPANPAGEPPLPSDPKQAWVNYAIASGMDWDTASRMTKADLQSRFGGRL